MIYVTITTVPDRLMDKEQMLIGIQSLLNQDTTEAYKVIVNIPYEYKNYESFNIPEWITELEKHNNKLIILRDYQDYGPITNLVFPLRQLEMDSEDILIVCDDDQEYESSMISYHLKTLEKYPGRHAVCFRGNGAMELRTWYYDNKKFAKFWIGHAFYPTDRDVYIKTPDHWHSVSYRRKFFEEDFLDDDFLNISWNNDYLIGVYAWNHKFYFLCPHVPEQTDNRPVNCDGRGSFSYPIKAKLSFNDGGCYRWRVKEQGNELPVVTVIPPHIENMIDNYNRLYYKDTIISEGGVLIDWNYTFGK